MHWTHIFVERELNRAAYKVIFPYLRIVICNTLNLVIYNFFADILKIQMLLIFPLSVLVSLFSISLEEELVFWRCNYILEDKILRENKVLHHAEPQIFFV